MAASQTIRTLKLALLADVSKFGPELKKSASDFDKFSEGVSRAAVPATAAIGAIGAAAFSAINAASDLSQTFGAVEQVFGGRAAARLDEFAREAANSLGQSRQQALGAAQTFGILGRTAGLEGDRLADFAIELSQLASDLAAFGNTNPQDAIEALGSALRGEFNPIERYGVVLNAAAVQQQALKAGLAETAQEITAADQVYARYLAIIEQTTIQQGQFAREQDSLSSQAAIAKANIENFRVEIGEQLVPALSAALPVLTGLVQQFAATDPELIVAIGTAILGLSVAINALNVSLKAFAALQGAYKLLTAGAGGVLGLAAAGPVAGIATVGVVDELGLGGVQGQVSTGGLRGLVPSGLPAAPAPRRTTNTTINITGFVGSEVELSRAIVRAQEQARRSGQLATPGRGQ